jgi:hypothetical protein
MAYYANWDYDTYRPHVLRRDTRIYWGAGNQAQASGRCVGTFIGENPGAGHAAGQQTGWGILVEGASKRPGDQTLRFLRDAWVAAVNTAGKSPPRDDDYIEVLNTYYFRCPESGGQLQNWRALGSRAIYFQSIHRDAKFVILGWGKVMNDSDECRDLLATLSGQPVIVSNVYGTVTVLPPPVRYPLPFYPAQPSAIARWGNSKTFFKNISGKLVSFV